MRKIKSRDVNKWALAAGSLLSGIIILLVLSSNSGSVGAQSASLKEETWIFTGTRLLNVRVLDPAFIDAAFNHPHNIIAGQDAFRLMDTYGWTIKPAQVYTSFQSFQAAVLDKRIDPRVKTVIYDNEVWDATPLAEQRNPELYTKLFSKLAKAQGYTFIAAPSCSLVGSKGYAYCTNNLIKKLAPYADYMVLQFQWAEGNPTAYKRYVLDAVSAIASSSPKTKVIAELSTNPAIPGSTPQNIAASAKGVAHKVTGFWLSIDLSEQGTKNALEFFKLY